ncbi:patched family-domain-containing protein [Pavlovales sp. CCMP2436]|nr:patched family-domain-containing protein [Pavlovales sp. CCMP2436]
MQIPGAIETPLSTGSIRSRLAMGGTSPRQVPLDQLPVGHTSSPHGSAALTPLATPIETPFATPLTSRRSAPVGQLSPGSQLLTIADSPPARDLRQPIRMGEAFTAPRRLRDLFRAVREDAPPSPATAAMERAATERRKQLFAIASTPPPKVPRRFLPPTSGPFARRMSASEAVPRTGTPTRLTQRASSVYAGTPPSSLARLLDPPASPTSEPPPSSFPEAKAAVNALEAALADAGLPGSGRAGDERADDRWYEGALPGVRPKRGFERFVASTLGYWGNHLSRAPWLVVVTTVLLHLCIASCVRWASFESDSHMLYIAQHSQIAHDRRHTQQAFGLNPSPFILVLRSRGGTTDVMTQEYMGKLLRLHDQLYKLEAPLPHASHSSRASGGGSAEPLQLRGSPDPFKGADAAKPLTPPRSESAEEPLERTVLFSDLCARRYVHSQAQSECIVVSPLQLWLYAEDTLTADLNVSKTLSDAYHEHLIDLGGRQLHEDEDGRLSGAQALISSYYLDSQLPGFADGRAAAWEAAARRVIDDFVTEERDVRVSLWSRHFNEEEASRFVKNDGYLIGVAFAVVLVYVALTLSHWGCNPARARYLLACSALASSALALASGLGLTALLGIPLTPITPLVCFTLLGVSVDDMIILTDAFDRIERAQRQLGNKRPPGGLVLGGALHEIGGAVTMTTLTTAATFLTGWRCDLPIYSYFCLCAALSMVALYHIQMTLYAALLLLDARRRHALVERLAANGLGVSSR